MNRFVFAAASLLLVACATFSATVHAEEWRWCSAADLSDSGPAHGPFLVAKPFRTDGAPDYEAQYATHARSVMGTVLGEFMVVCSPAFPTWEDTLAAQHEWIESTYGLIPMDHIDWTPGGGAGGVAHDGGDGYDSTGAAGGRAFCMLQDNVDGQPRAMFSLVFAPPDLESDWDARMARRFIDYAQGMHGARPDATATCHRHDTEAGAHDMRGHEAEMRRIQDWTVVMTHWSN